MRNRGNTSLLLSHVYEWPRDLIDFSVCMFYLLDLLYYLFQLILLILFLLVLCTNSGYNNFTYLINSITKHLQPKLCKYVHSPSVYTDIYDFCGCKQSWHLTVHKIEIYSNFNSWVMHLTSKPPNFSYWQMIWAHDLLSSGSWNRNLLICVVSGNVQISHTPR